MFVRQSDSKNWFAPESTLTPSCLVACRKPLSFDWTPKSGCCANGEPSISPDPMLVPDPRASLEFYPLRALFVTSPLNVTSWRNPTRSFKLSGRDPSHGRHSYPQSPGEPAFGLPYEPSSEENAMFWKTSFVSLFSVALMMTASIAQSADLKVGDDAPDFDLKASDGKSYKLSSFKGKQAVVVAWFPKAFPTSPRK